MCNERYGRDASLGHQKLSVGEELPCKREGGNGKDPHAVAVL